MADWSKSLITEFVNLYKRRPSLWNQNLTDYNKQPAREAAYEELIVFLKQRGMSNATDKTVKDKIQNLRRMYRRERAKVELSKKSSGNLYVPTLWYYELLTFLNDDETDYRLNIVAESAEIDNNYPEIIIESCNSEADGGAYKIKDEPDETRSQLRATRQITRRANKKLKVEDTVSLAITEPLKNSTEVYCSKKPSDEHDALGIIVTSKIKKMKTDQQIHAEMLIHKILGKGLLGHLSDTMDVVDTQKLLSQSNIDRSHAF